MTEKERRSVQNGRDPDREALLDEVTDATLHTLRMPRKLLGYRYLFLAIRYVLSKPSDAHPNMLKEIYPHVANAAGTSRVMASAAHRSGRIQSCCIRISVFAGRIFKTRRPTWNSSISLRNACG